MALPGPFKPMPGNYNYKALVVDVIPGRFIVLLTVKGFCPNVEFGHKFIPYPRLPMGLVFEGIIGPGLPIPRAISYDQTFRMPILPPELQYFTVVDANHPQGVRVPWSFKPGVVVPFAPSSSSNKQLATSDLSQLIVLPPKPITVFVGQEFSIEATINVEGNRNRYESEMLDLIEAGTNGSNQIFWRYKAVAPGVTTVTVTQGFGWDILEWKVTVLPPLNNLALAASPSPQIFVEFLASVGNAIEIVRKGWPTAELHYVSAKPKPPQDTTSPFQLKWLRATFFTKEQTITIKTIGSWAFWGPPQARPPYISGNNKITWPLEGDLDLAKAYDLVQAAQPHHDPIKEAWLHYPLLQPDNPDLKDQPLYYFLTQSDSQWAIGSKSQVPVLTYEPEFRINEITDGSDPFVPQPSGAFNAAGFIKASEDTNGVDDPTSALQKLGPGSAAVDQAAAGPKIPVGVAA